MEFIKRLERRVDHVVNFPYFFIKKDQKVCDINHSDITTQDIFDYFNLKLSATEIKILSVLKKPALYTILSRGLLDGRYSVN